MLVHEVFDKAVSYRKDLWCFHNKYSFYPFWVVGFKDGDEFPEYDHPRPVEMLLVTQMLQVNDGGECFDMSVILN